MAKLEGHKGKVAEINKALRDQLGLKKNETIPVTYSLLIQKTATDMCMLDKVAEELSKETDLTSLEVGSMGQQKTVVNPLIPYYDKLSARVTDDLYNLGLTARKQAIKSEDPAKKEDQDAMQQYLDNLQS
jgi:hypothetical protein